MVHGTTRAETLATGLLLKQRLCGLKLDITALRYSKNIIFDTFEGFCRNTRARLCELGRENGMRDGCVIKRGDGEDALYIVLYNGKIRPRGRIGFTLAHEVGHIYLEHSLDGAKEEAEADLFAAELLMPRVLVCELMLRYGSLLTPVELSRVFGVSAAAAANRLNFLKDPESHAFSQDERMLLKKLSGFLPSLDGPIIDC